MRSTTIFQEKNRRIIKSLRRMGNKSLLSRIYDTSLYLSFREDFLIFGYIYFEALEELNEYIEPSNIEHLMSSIHLILLSGYHTYNLPMYYNLDVTVLQEQTLHKYCNESIAELIIIILSRNGVKRLLEWQVYKVAAIFN